MSSSALFAVLALSLAVALVVWTVVTGLGGDRARTVSNLTLGLDVAPADGRPAQDEDSTPGPLIVLARRLTPAGSIRMLERLLSRAGRPPGWSLDRLLVVKLALGLGVGALSVLFIRSTEGPLPVLLGLATTVVCYFLPELLLHSRGQERSQAIQLELADTLDQMTIAVEAGLGFDSAMSRAGKNGTGPLAEELVRTLQEIQVGQTRRQAYESLATRSDVADLRRFVRAIIQADAYGISIADVLRTQAAEMRMKRRQRAEEKAMQIPVKVIFPLILCILPVLFIVLLGPTAMNMMEAFS
ncbi:MULTISPECIES: type II secretion system F family protein [unclassified Dietzia]|uniref:type II secretion system F family protein n=2 Tax=Dietzia TaxID=37914 RepID=UPI0015F78DB8|nr:MULTISPECIES: type II secretion system F family protein [unclassified Dietzia]MBB1024471.1 type II secretion system F family protein [Dietzia sp. DQ12-76]